MKIPSLLRRTPTFSYYTYWSTLRPMAKKNESGYVLITMAISMVVLFGMLGLAFDLGRVFITKNELQAYADAAALASSLQLNGHSVGFTNAYGQVKPTATAPMSVNHWNFS